MPLIGRWLGGRAVLLVGVAVLGALVLLTRGWQQGDILPGWQGPDAEQARLEFEQRAPALHRRMQRKQRVVQAVLAGRVTLLEAAAYFRALDREGPSYNWDYFRARWPGDSDDERHCHQVLDFVYLQMGGSNGSPAEPVNCMAEAARTKLRAELDEHLRRGQLRLPEVTEFPAFLEHD
jgi:hypothetical protein